MVNKGDVGDYYPGFNQPSKRSHFNNPISSNINTNPERQELVEMFKQKPGINADMTIDPNADSASELVKFVIANRDFELGGTNVATAQCAFGTNHAGLLLTTTSGASDQVIVQPHTNTGQTGWTNVKWGTENRVVWEAVVRTGASVASIKIWAGLKLTSTSTVITDDDAAYFRFDAGVANWEATTSIADTDVEYDTGVVVAINTNYYFRIEIDSNRIPHFFINDKEVYEGTALTNDKNLIPYIGVQGNAKTLHVIKTKISRILFE